MKYCFMKYTLIFIALMYYAIGQRYSHILAWKFFDLRIKITANISQITNIENSINVEFYFCYTISLCNYLFNNP